MSYLARKISNNKSVYRGLVIRKLPNKKLSPITRYKVSDFEYSYGLFDTLAEAMKYIDKLIGDIE
ncbi:hypothetical protein AB7X03_14295 [Providencia rettgeri]